MDYFLGWVVIFSLVFNLNLTIVLIPPIWDSFLFITSIFTSFFLLKIHAHHIHNNNNKFNSNTYTYRIQTMWICYINWAAVTHKIYANKKKANCKLNTTMCTYIKRFNCRIFIKRNTVLDLMDELFSKLVHTNTWHKSINEIMMANFQWNK